MPPSAKVFTPLALRDRESLASLSILSSSYFRVANELRAMAAADNSSWPGRSYVFPAVTMYTAAFEAFLQEHLALSAFHLEKSNDAQNSCNLEHISDLKTQQRPYNDFKKWVKEIYRLYDSQGVGLDPNCDEYQNLLALKELRNSVVHYNPTFIQYASWPARLEQALHCTKLEVMNAGWATNFQQIEVTDWAHATVKGAIELFCIISGAENPFTTTDAEGMLNWEYVRPSSTSPC